MSTKQRTEVQVQDTWDLSPLFASEAAWEAAAQKFPDELAEVATFAGNLGKNAATLAKALDVYHSVQRKLDLICEYAHRLSDQDTSNSHHLGMKQRTIGLSAQFATATAYMQPEILALEDATLQKFLADPRLSAYARTLDEILRYKSHTLDEQQETLLAQATELFYSPSEIYSQLNNADFNFGTLMIDGVEKTLTHSSYQTFLKHPSRDIRRQAFEKHYTVYEAHQYSLAAVLTASLRTDYFMAKARRYSSTLEMRLYPDRVAKEAFENLINTVAAHQQTLAKYNRLRARVLKLSRIALYDTVVPLVPSTTFHTPYENGVKLIIDALKPLGEEYCAVLAAGLGSSRWVDKYENKGKRSGAYSAGCYQTPCYILMNYQEDNIQDLFTLAHEAGHSMHSYFSHRNQTYQDSQYPIITAEVASTFNEQLLFAHLNKIEKDPLKQAYLLTQHLDEINGTLFRQVMYSDFEHKAHATLERGAPLTSERFRALWRESFEKFNGDTIELDEIAETGCFRIPHFYHSFYVYKYATGLAAAISLSEQVLEKGGEATRRYLGFLKSGGSVPPLDTLAKAGVDIRSPEPIEYVMQLFERLCAELEAKLLQVKAH
jgi:oligoendopeptidase F